MAVRKKISPRYNKILKNYLRTGSLEKTGQLEPTLTTKGSRTQKVFQVLKNPNVQAQYYEELVRQGFDISEYARFLINQTKAKKTLVVKHRGQVTDTLEVDDHKAQLKALKMIGEVFDVFRKEKPTRKNRESDLDRYLDKLSPEELEELLSFVSNAMETETESV
ncbi:hypothetical protein ACFL5H_02770 [Candidatus Latescibacterota bacterium]